MFSPFSAAFYTAVISFLAGPVLYALNQFQQMHDEIFLASVAVAICTAIFVLSYVLVYSRLPSTCRKDPYLAWFSLFAFTAIVDLLLAFNISGEIHIMDW
jgi:hypothetical protein